MMRNAPKSGVERIKREKEEKKSDSSKVEIKWKIAKFGNKKYKKEKRVTYTKGEKKEKGKAKEYKKIKK